MATNYRFHRLPIHGRSASVARNIYDLANVPESVVAGVTANKEIMDRVYQAASRLLHEHLHSSDLASWLTLALEQFDYHSSLRADCANVDDDLHEQAKSAPAWRYCWRYLIDYCVRNLHPESSLTLMPPSYRDVETVATCLIMMYGTAEMSNWLYYFPEVYAHVEGHYDHDRFVAASLKLPGEAEARKAAIQENLKPERINDEFAHLLPPFENGSSMRNELDAYLQVHYGLVTDELLEFGGCVADYYNPDTMESTVVVGEFDSFTQYLASQSNLGEKKARAFLLLTLKDAASARVEAPRDFLSRSNRRRMGFYGGVRIAGMTLPGRLHSPTWKDKPSVWSLRDRDMVVVSALSMIEAPLLQLALLVHGQVHHLGPVEVGRRALGALRRNYRVNCFEGEVRSLFRRAGWSVIGPVLKANVSQGFTFIPCGEIDALAFHTTSNRLLVVEAKCLPLSTDVKMWHGDATDFEQKYRPKIEKKVAWCIANRQAVNSCFLAEGAKVLEVTDAQVSSLFVTLQPNMSAMLQHQHRVLSISKLKAALTEGTL